MADRSKIEWLSTVNPDGSITPGATWNPIVGCDKVSSGCAKRTARGAKNGNWKGGRSVASNGYVLIRVGVGHPAADVRGYAYEHRLVAEATLGRPLREGEQVHHKNGDKTDNRPENLEVMGNAAEHRLQHRTRQSGRRLPGEANPTLDCPCGCGGTFSKFDESGRPRAYISGHNKQPSPTADAVVDALKDGPLSRADLSLTTGIPLQALATALSKLKRQSVVKQVRHGVWAVASSGGPN